jgi:hypothetical protein
MKTMPPPDNPLTIGGITSASLTRECAARVARLPKIDASIARLRGTLAKGNFSRPDEGAWRMALRAMERHRDYIVKDAAWAGIRVPFAEPRIVASQPSSPDPDQAAA